MESSASPLDRVRVRSYEPRDREACARLYVEGLIGGHLAENDTGMDIDDIESAYMKAGSHFWVAETSDGEVVGMIGVQEHGEGAAEVRRLRVAQHARRRGIGTRLMETALRFCQRMGYPKVTLDTFMEREPALRLFEKFRFQHSRTQTVGERQIMHFYLDLYFRERRPGQGEG